MLMEEHYNKHRPIAYYKRQLNLVAPAYPSSLKAIARAAKLQEVSADLTLRNNSYLQTLHPVQSLLNSKLTQHFSASRPTCSKMFLLSPPNYILNTAKSLTLPHYTLLG